MSLWVQETYINRTLNAAYGESDVHEAFADTPGELYRFLQKEYGRCTSAIYIDTQEGTKRIGWVFLKRAKYRDCDDTYLQETWVTLHEGPPEKTITYQYHVL